MKLWWMQHPIRNSIIAVTLIIILVIAVWGSVLDDDSNQPQAVEENENSRTVEPDPVSKEPLFSVGVTEISILESGPDSQHSIVKFEGARMHTEEQTYALHYPDAYMFVSFQDTDPDQIDKWLKQISFEGELAQMKVERTNTLEHDEVRYKYNFDGISQGGTLRFGDLPPIHLKPTEGFVTMAATADSSSVGRDSILLMGREVGNVLIIQDSAPVADLYFSEDMRLVDVVERTDTEINIKETWVSSRHLRLPVRQDVTSQHFSLDGLYSMDGNFMPPMHQFIELRKVPPRDWLLYPTGKRAFDSSYARYYDSMIYSPNRQAVIGFVYLGGSVADEGGAYYGLVLDRGDGNPVLIEDMIHFPSRLIDPPVQWVNDEQIVYAKWEGIYRYDLATDTSRAIYDQGHANVMAYDAVSDRLYTFRLRNDGGDPELPDYQADRIVISGVSGDQPQTVVEPNWTETFSAQWLNTMRLDIHPTPKGVFWTKSKDRQVSTVFEDRQGMTYEAPGKVLTMVDHDTVFLTEVTYDYEKMPVIWEWTAGEKPKPIPPAPYRADVFGPYLISENPNNGWVRYDRTTGTWVDFPEYTDWEHFPETNMEPLYYE